MHKPNINNIFSEKWCVYNHREADKILDKIDILAESLWFNSNIKIDKSTIFKRNWYNRGIKVIGDLVTDDRWLTLVELNTMCKVEFLEYMSVLSSIPKQWRWEVKQGKVDVDSISPRSNLEELIHSDKPSSLVRKVLARRICTPPFDRITKWEDELNIEIDHDEWLDNCCNMHKTIKVSQLRSFAYRLCTRDVLTNSKLIKMGLSDTDICYLCGIAKETISHMFWYCKINQRLWERLKVLIGNSLGYNLELHPEICLLDMSIDNNYKFIPPLVKIILIIFKKYLHDSKCKGLRTDFNCFLGKLKGVANLEIKMAEKTQGGGKIKWSKGWTKVLESIDRSKN